MSKENCGNPHCAVCAAAENTEDLRSHRLAPADVALIEQLPEILKVYETLSGNKVSMQLAIDFGPANGSEESRVSTWSYCRDLNLDGKVEATLVNALDVGSYFNILAVADGDLTQVPAEVISGAMRRQIRGYVETGAFCVDKGGMRVFTKKGETRRQAAERIADGLLKDYGQGGVKMVMDIMQALSQGNGKPKSEPVKVKRVNDANDANLPEPLRKLLQALGGTIESVSDNGESVEGVIRLTPDQFDAEKLKKLAEAEGIEGLQVIRVDNIDDPERSVKVYNLGGPEMSRAEIEDIIRGVEAEVSKERQGKISSEGRPDLQEILKTFFSKNPSDDTPRH